jgi:RND family efflux transporter MFP subunit
MFAALAALLVACSGGPPDGLPTATAARGELAVVLGVPGELKAVRSENVNAPNVRGGLKITRLAEEGARVKPGDLLVEFDRADLEKELESAQSRLRVAQTKIAQKEAQTQVRLGTAQNEVTRTELDRKRAEMRVTESETVPRVERESAKLDVTQSNLALERAAAALRSAELETAAELELLRLEAAEAEAKVRQIEGQLGQLEIRAKGDGIVLLVESWRAGKHGKATIGDSVWPGNPIMELPDLSAMRVEAWVHEVDANLVAVGQSVNVVVDARPDAPLHGKVERVSDLAVQREEDSAVKHLEVHISLASTEPTLKPGMTVRAEIEVERLSDVLTMPREAVFYEGAEAFAWRQVLGRWTRAPVTLGKTNDTHVVLLSGLEAGDRVALVDPSGNAQASAAPSSSAAPSPAAAAAP